MWNHVSIKQSIGRLQRTCSHECYLTHPPKICPHDSDQNQIQGLIDHINQIIGLENVEWQTDDKEVNIKDVTLFGTCWETKINEIHQRLNVAMTNGSLPLIKLFVAELKSCQDPEFLSWLMADAIEHGHNHIAWFLFDIGLSQFNNNHYFVCLLNSATRCNNVEMQKLICQTLKTRENGRSVIEGAFYESTDHINIDTIQYFIEEQKIDIDDIITHLQDTGDLDNADLNIVDYLRRNHQLLLNGNANQDMNKDDNAEEEEDVEQVEDDWNQEEVDENEDL